MKNLTAGDSARIRSRQDISRVMLTWRPKRGKTHQRVVSWQSPAIAVPGCDTDEAKLRRHTSASRCWFCRSGGSRKQTVQEAKLTGYLLTPAVDIRMMQIQRRGKPCQKLCAVNRAEAVLCKPCCACCKSIAEFQRLEAVPYANANDAVLRCSSILQIAMIMPTQIDWKTSYRQGFSTGGTECAMHIMHGMLYFNAQFIALPMKVEQRDSTIGHRRKHSYKQQL